MLDVIYNCTSKYIIIRIHFKSRGSNYVYHYVKHLPTGQEINKYQAVKTTTASNVKLSVATVRNVKQTSTAQQRQDLSSSQQQQEMSDCHQQRTRQKNVKQSTTITRNDKQSA